MAGTGKYLRTWLDLDGGGLIHAGDHLRAVLHISCGAPDVLLLFSTVQLVGELRPDDRIVRIESAGGFRRKSIVGGGSGLTATAAEGVQLFACAPAIIATDEPLHEHVLYSCKDQPSNFFSW